MSYLAKYFHDTPEGERTVGATAFFASLDQVATVAPSITTAIIAELRDQGSHLKLIASENYSSLAVQQAMGNLLTDKYAEGVPFRRFYAGCEHVDAIEAEAVTELKLLYRAQHAYVQPHSGADANLVAYWAILSERVQSKEVERLGKKSIDELSEEEHEALRQLMMGQKVMGMSLGSGGHLTHGYRHNLSSKMMRSTFYDVDPETGLLDYEVLERRVLEERPDILLAGYSAYPRKLDFARFREIADKVGATLMVDMAHLSGLIAGRVFLGEFNPVPYADIITSTTHKTLRGPRGGFVLCTDRYREFVDKGCPMVLGGPLPHVIAAKTVAFKEASRPSFEVYAHQVVENAQTLAEALMAEGATVLTGGTDNHMVLVDVRPFGLTGRQAESVLRECKLTVNRNSLPADPNGPWYTSGIRLGTPATTTLGMGRSEMQKIAELLLMGLKHAKPATGEGGKVSRAKAELPSEIRERIRGEVDDLLSAYPLYPELRLAGTTTPVAV